MLSFQDYVWECRIANLRSQITKRLQNSGQTLESVMKRINGETRLQNEFFGGFINRLGAAWNAFWQQDEEQPKFSAKDVQAYTGDVTREIQEQLKGLIEELRKNGSNNKEVESSLYKIMEKIGGDFHDIKKTLREKSTEDQNAKKDGILEKFVHAVEKLEDLSQDPRFSPKDRLAQINHTEQDLASAKKEAEKMVSSADAIDSKEAKIVIDRMAGEKLANVLAAIQKIKQQIEAKVNSFPPDDGKIGAFDARSNNDQESEHTLPDDVKQAFQELQKIPGMEQNAALDVWWKSKSAADKQKIFDELDLGPSSLESLNDGSRLRAALWKAHRNGKI